MFRASKSESVGPTARLAGMDVFADHWIGVKLTIFDVCLHTRRIRSGRPNIRTMNRAHTAVQCTERSVLKGKCAPATLRTAQSSQRVLH